jgi:hypothetical protein
MAVYACLVRSWHLRWGATGAEVARPLPGDALGLDPTFVSTRALTIQDPVEAVWPWLVQLGYGRGGFYSYDWLVNLFGRLLRGTPGYRSVETIVPEFQDLRPGDIILTGPAAMLGGRRAETARWTVEAVVPNWALVLRGWGSFVLEPIDARTTRLIVRRNGIALGSRVMRRLFWEPAYFVMERRMLLGIKERAERLTAVTKRAPASPGEARDPGPVTRRTSAPDVSARWGGGHARSS